MQIVPLQTAHLDEAARLFVARYRQERAVAPALPARHEDPSGVLPLLDRLLGKAPGVAALADGRLCGYLSGFPIANFKGTQRGVFSPVWAHAAVGDDRVAVYRYMYEHLSRQWVAAGCLTHAISLYAQDAEAADIWFRNCFGLLVVDALRPLAPVAGVPPAGVEIRQATAADVDLILPLVEGLGRYLADGPIFLALLEMPTRPEYTEWLAEPAHTLWLALHDGEAIAYIRAQPPTCDVAYVVGDPQTISITGAYTRPEWRGRGVATALLGRVVDWARENGYARCAVDFEAQNIWGSRFWLSHFQPTCHSLMRHVDERITWAHAARPAADAW